jgi:hypothetical protein
MSVLIGLKSAYGGTVLLVEIRTMRAFHFRYSPIARAEVSEILKNSDALQKNLRQRASSVRSNFATKRFRDY